MRAIWEDVSNMVSRNRRIAVVICICVVAIGLLAHNDVFKLFRQLGGGGALIEKIRERDKLKTKTEQETNRDMDTERRWGLGDKDSHRSMEQGRKLINVDVLNLTDMLMTDEINWPEYEKLIMKVKWNHSQTNVTRFREELKAANIDIRGRFLMSNATSKEGQQLTAYLTGENLTLTSIFMQRQDEVSPFDKSKSFKKCSVIGNSGILVNSMCGFRIDDADFVFRVNVPEIDPFVQDVGFKTDFTTLNPSIFKRKYNYFGSQQLTDKFNSDMAQFQGILMIPCFSDVQWMPVCTRALKRLTPKKYLKVAFGDPEQFSLIRDYWFTKGLSKYPSTGLYLATAAIGLCDEVHLYGFWPFDDSTMAHVSSHPIKYHYFDNTHMVRTHDMRSEFGMLIKLHQQGVLRIHLQNCEEEEQAELADASRNTRALKMSNKAAEITTPVHRIDIDKLWGNV